MLVSDLEESNADLHKDEITRLSLDHNLASTCAR
jgi:hypothetical protein